jgi:hypothetical protein
MRRAAWQYPEGIGPIAEDWAAAAVQVVTIFSADSFDKVLEILFEWNGAFDIGIHPAVSAEEGLRYWDGYRGCSSLNQAREGTPSVICRPESRCRRGSRSGHRRGRDRRGAG